jgi:serine-type D-Ala-D-Ala carboxypeptidase/endopeptidase (penicillin-binding protein 4)
MMVRIFYLLLAACLVVSCSPVSRRQLTRTFRSTEGVFQDHTGFMLYDPESKRTIYEYNAAKYFTPASNTKILTLFASLNILGDSVPALRYLVRGDSMIFWGTGDPSFLNRNTYDNRRVYSFLQSTGKKLFFSTANFNSEHFGPGWAWDDYESSYSAERSPLPLYGNLLLIQGAGRTVTTEPPFMQKNLIVANQSQKVFVTRERDNNTFIISPSDDKKFEFNIPFKVDPILINQLLADTLKRSVQYIEKPLPREASILFSVPADSLYRVLMEDSDNFVAEQLLLLCSGTIGDTLNPERTIRYVINTYLTNLPDKPVWVDGSGLSRYNLLTPRSVVFLWDKIYSLVPEERLFGMLATGGKSGTIRNWYNGEGDKPYIFGKTGTLRHNHCLSGYLVTRSGKTLIFSFMNSNFTSPLNDIRKNMQTILNLIYEHY